MSATCYLARRAAELTLRCRTLVTPDLPAIIVDKKESQFAKT